MKPNVYETLESSLESVENRFEEKGVSAGSWFRLAMIAVRCLIYIASAICDKDGKP